MAAAESELSGGSTDILLVVPAPPGTSYHRCDSLRSATQAPQLLRAATPGSAASNFNKLPDSFPNHSFSWSSILHCSYCRFPTIPPLPFWNLCHPRANEKVLKKKKHTAIRDFPGGPVVRNLPCNAGNVGSIPGWGTKIPRVVGATEPMCLNYRTRNKTTTKDPTCHDQDSMQSDKQIKITPEKAIAIGQVCVLISFVVGFYCCVIRRHTGKYLLAFRRLGTSVQLL